MHEAVSTPERPSSLRRVLIPLLAILLPVLSLVLIRLQYRTEVMPEAQIPLFIIFELTTLIALLVVPIWFFFFSGLRLVTKFAGVAVVLVLIGVLVGITRRVEFSGRMGPVFVFRWQPDPESELERRLSQLDRNQLPVLAAADLAIGPDDYPRYRGPAADGVAAPVAVPANWSANPPKEVWRTPVGWSYSGIAVAGKVAITIEQRKDEEAVVCYDRADGKELWAYQYPAKFEQVAPMGGPGPRSTPTIADGDVYSLGAMGDLVCLDGANGKPRWPPVNVVKDNGAKVVQWGMTSSPLIVGDLVVVNSGIDPEDNKGQAVAAYDRKTGKKVWAKGNHPAGYSSPMLAKLAGFEQIILFDGGGLAGIDPADGKELWRYPWTTFSEMNIIQPLVLPGDRVFISSEQTNGCAAVQVKKSGSGWAADKAWANRNMASRFANPVYHEGHIYGLSNGALVCLDAQTGKRLWRGESFGSGQLVLTGGTLLVQSEFGELAAVATDPAEYRELGRITVFKDSRTWNTPTLAGGRVYLRNHEKMACLELPR
jgi:outer membrane protein assembly factor BamB